MNAETRSHFIFKNAAQAGTVLYYIFAVDVVICKSKKKHTQNIIRLQMKCGTFYKAKKKVLFKWNGKNGKYTYIKVHGIIII